MRLHSTAQAQLALDRVTVNIPSKEPNGRIYLTWRPVKSQASCKSSSGKPTNVDLYNAKVTGGRVVLGDSPGRTKNYHIKLTLPADGTPVDFWIGGAWPSSEDLDAVLQVSGDIGKVALATIPMMVRIRKNALSLTLSERFRFLRALAKMNAKPTGSYAAMRFAHIAGMEDEAHSNPAFLPWHRAYMLDFERELQAIDPSVALPYWRFDKPAPALFSQFFLGAEGDDEFVEFYSKNPLAGWTFLGRAGIVRSSRWWSDPATDGADVVGDPLLADTAPTTFDDFRTMERDPHDRAHVSWNGDISSVPTAPLDPLFFLLHSNVDRLWASWQSKARPTRIHPFHSYAFSSNQHVGEIQPRIGHHGGDTMWPWNLVTGSMTDPRPTIANTVGKMRPSQITDAPPESPLVRDMIDYQGIHTGKHLGFDYDNIPFPKDP